MTLNLTDPSLLKQQAYIGGQWSAGRSGKTFAVTNPADGSLIAEVPDMGADETREAIARADRAWDGWRSRTAKERATVLRRWYELVIAAQVDLAILMTAEQGKPMAESMGEVIYGAGFIEWFSEEARRTRGDVIPAHGTDKRIVVIRQSVGVCAAITPWNFPIAMITRKAAAALAAGCPMVLKPSEDTPLSALALAELGERAGIPPGVFSVVTASRRNAPEVGLELTGNRLVRKLSFTGSTATGKVLMRQCSDSVKKVSLELGGNAPFIVFDDADLDAAVNGLMASKFRNTGQTCVCANRIFVQDSVYDAFSAKLCEAVSKLVVGPGLGGVTHQGPLINEAALNKVQRHVDDALEKGARILIGGRPHGHGGTFYEPTVLGEANPRMVMFSEETFGPVAPLFRFKSDDEVIALANATEFGLAAYFYSRDVGRAWRVAEALECGMVGVNEGLISTEIAPFGGIKESGLGREGSQYGIDEYLELKYVCMGGI